MAKRPGPGPDELDADLIDPALLGDAGDGEGAVAALTDELDLHTFLPRDCADVVAEYLHAAQAAGMTDVRIIHGKGTGTLRRIVHGVLDRNPELRLVIIGHPDRDGADELAQRRAEAVKWHLIDQGIPEDRVVTRVGAVAGPPPVTFQLLSQRP